MRCMHCHAEPKEYIEFTYIKETEIWEEKYRIGVLCLDCFIGLMNRAAEREEIKIAPLIR